MSLTEIKGRVDSLAKLLDLSDDPDVSVITELKEISAMLSAEGGATAHVAKEEDLTPAERPDVPDGHKVPPPVVNEEKD